MKELIERLKRMKVNFELRTDDELLREVFNQDYNYIEQALTAPLPSEVEEAYYEVLDYLNCEYVSPYNDNMKVILKALRLQPHAIKVLCSACGSDAQIGLDGEYYCPNPLCSNLDIQEELITIGGIHTPHRTKEQYIEEICKALSEYYRAEVEYNNGLFNVYDCKNQKTWGRQNREISLDELYDKPHLIAMIGDFLTEYGDKK